MSRTARVFNAPAVRFLQTPSKIFNYTKKISL